MTYEEYQRFTAKRIADDKALKAADEARAAEEKRERIAEAIYAAAFVRMYCEKVDGPAPENEVARAATFAWCVSKDWREAVTAKAGKMDKGVKT